MSVANPVQLVLTANVSQRGARESMSEKKSVQPLNGSRKSWSDESETLDDKIRVENVKGELRPGGDRMNVMGVAMTRFVANGGAVRWAPRGPWLPSSAREC